MRLCVLLVVVGVITATSITPRQQLLGHFQQHSIKRLKRWSFWSSSKDEESTTTEAIVPLEVTDTTPAPTREVAVTTEEPSRGFWGSMNPFNSISNLVKKGYQKVKNSTLGQRVRNSAVGQAFRQGRNATRRSFILIGRKMRSGMQSVGRAVRKIKRRLTGEEKYRYFVEQVREGVDRGDKNTLSMLNRLGINVTVDEDGVAHTAVRNDTPTATELLENEGFYHSNVSNGTQGEGIDGTSITIEDSEETDRGGLYPVLPPDGGSDTNIEEPLEECDEIRCYGGAPPTTDNRTGSTATGDESSSDETDSVEKFVSAETGEDFTSTSSSGEASPELIPTSEYPSSTSMPESYDVVTTPTESTTWSTSTSSTTPSGVVYNTPKPEHDSSGLGVTDTSLIPTEAYKLTTAETFTSAATDKPFIATTEPPQTMTTLPTSTPIGRNTLPTTGTTLAPVSMPSTTHQPTTAPLTTMSTHTISPIINLPPTPATTTSQPTTFLTTMLPTTTQSTTLPLTTTLPTTTQQATFPTTSTSPTTLPPTTTQRPTLPPTTTLPTTTQRATSTTTLPTTTQRATSTTTLPTTTQQAALPPTTTLPITTQRTTSLPTTKLPTTTQRATSPPTTTLPTTTQRAISQPSTLLPTTTTLPTTIAPTPPEETERFEGAGGEPVDSNETDDFPSPFGGSSDSGDDDFPSPFGGSSDSGDDEFPDVFNNRGVRDRLREIYERGDFSHDDLRNAFNFDPKDYHYYYDYDY